MTNQVKFSKITRVGNSSAVIIPKAFLEFFRISAKDKIELKQTNEGILIKPMADWTQEKQALAFQIVSENILAMEEEPLPGDFLDKIRFKFSDKTNLFSEVTK